MGRRFESSLRHQKINRKYRQSAGKLNSLLWQIPGRFSILRRCHSRHSILAPGSLTDGSSKGSEHRIKGLRHRAPGSYVGGFVVLEVIDAETARVGIGEAMARAVLTVEDEIHAGIIKYPAGRPDIPTTSQPVARTRLAAISAPDSACFGEFIKYKSRLFVRLLAIVSQLNCVIEFIAISQHAATTG